MTKVSKKTPKPARDFATFRACLTEARNVLGLVGEFGTVRELGQLRKIMRDLGWQRHGE